MGTKRTPTGQTSLPGTRSGGARRQVGSTERYAGADLKRLRELELVPPGMTALEKVYRELGATFDAAVKNDDVYGRINTARELLRVRAALAPLVVDAAGMTIEDMLAVLNVPST